MPSPETNFLTRGKKMRLFCLALWPSFLAACALEFLIFALVDPGEVNWPSSWGHPSRRSVYTLGFFAFWAVTLSSSVLLLWMTEADPNASAPPAVTDNSVN